MPFRDDVPQEFRRARKSVHVAILHVDEAIDKLVATMKRQPPNVMPVRAEDAAWVDAGDREALQDMRGSLREVLRALRDVGSVDEE